ncbi:MAG: ABC transporter substrate-binding protein [Giesbergeria sp.]|nr:ABC transporter substrate-binding protein [Giesbergeria sp.]
MTVNRRNTLCALGCAAWGLAAAPAQAKASVDSVVISISLEPDSLDPTASASASVGEVVHYNVLENLVRINEDGTLSGQLAHTWSQDSSGLHYTFRLRKDVVFHDGAVFDAQAVRFSFERASAPASTNKAKKSLFGNIARIDTPDPYTVVLTLRHPDAGVLFRLGESPAVILSPASAAQAASAPIGTGPYQFFEWRKGWGVVLAKATRYRDAAHTKLAQATVRFIPNPAVQAQAVRSGEVDVFFNIATDNGLRFRSDPRYQVLVGASNGKGMLAFNHRRPPLNDVRVRRAITHAIDREGFIKNVLHGQGSAIGSHFTPVDAGYVHLTGVYPFDPARARALLAEAGVTLPLKLTLTLPPTPYARAGGPVVAAALERVGIALQIELVDWAQWLAGTFKGDFDVTLINHVEPLDYKIYTDPQYYFGYDSADFRALVALHDAAPNARARALRFAQLQRHLAADAANAWIFTPQLSTVARKGLKGLWMNYPIFAHDLAAMSWE